MEDKIKRVKEKSTGSSKEKNRPTGEVCTNEATKNVVDRMTGVSHSKS